MPTLDCGCNIVVTVEMGIMVLQAEYCPLHGAAGELRDRLAETLSWVVDNDLRGLTVDQVNRFRDCLMRARTALAMATRSKGEDLKRQND